MSRRSLSSMRSPKFCTENQIQLSRLLSSTCSKSSINHSQISCSKSPLDTVSFSRENRENIQGSSALLASELDKLIVVNNELTREISTWKRKYKDCFRLIQQGLPTDMETESNETYKQKYTNLKAKAVDLKKGFKALEVVVVEKNQEIETWKEKYNQMENEYMDQIQNLRNQIEVVLRTHIEKEVTIALNHLEKEQISKEESWNALLLKLQASQNELKSSNEERDIALKQLQETKEKLTIAEDKIIDLNSLERELRILNEENENTVKKLAQVKEQLSAKEINCHSIQSKYTALNAETEKLRACMKEQTVQFEQTKKEVETANREKEKVSKQLDQAREQVKTAEKNYKDVQCKYILLSGEADKLQGKDGKVARLQEELGNIIRERDTTLGQLEDIRAELLVVKDNKNARVSALAEEVNVLSEEKENMLRELKSVQGKLLFAEERNNTISNDNQGAQNRNRVLNVEIESLRALEEENISKINQLRKEKDVASSQFERARSELDTLKESYAGLLNQIDRLRAADREKDVKLNELTIKNTSLTEQKNNAVKQFEQTKGILSAVEKNYKEIYSKNIIFKTEVQSLEDVIRDMTTKTNQLEETLSTKNSNISAKEVELRTCQDKLASLGEETKSLRDMTKSLNRELEAYKSSQTSIEGRSLTYLEELKKSDQAFRTLEAKLEAEVSQKVQIEKEASELKKQAKRKEQEFELIQKDKLLACEQYEKRIQALIERNSAMVTREGELQLRIEELASKAQGKDEFEKKAEVLSQELLALRSSYEVEKQEAQRVSLCLQAKLKELENNCKRLGSEASEWRKKYEDQELKNIQEINRIRCDAENVWRKRMETEIESKNLNIRYKDEEVLRGKSEHERTLRSLEQKLQAQNDRVAEFESERRILIEKNERLNSQVSQVLQEIETARVRHEEDAERENRLMNAKYDLEKEKRVQLEKEFANLEIQSKNWKAKVEDFELRQVMYFIEIERLYAINAELINDVNKLTQDLKDASMELDKNRQILLEVSKAETFRTQQKDQFDEVAGDLKKQIEGIEMKFQLHFNSDKPQKTEKVPPLRMQDLAIETPAKNQGDLAGKKIKKEHLTSLQKSHAELLDLAMKFETEKKIMENQLDQFKKIVDINKLEMRRFNENSLQIRTTHDNRVAEIMIPKTPCNTEPGVLYDQCQSQRERDDLRMKNSLKQGKRFQFPGASAGKENVRAISPLTIKSPTGSSTSGFKMSHRDEDFSFTPRITLFK